MAILVNRRNDCHKVLRLKTNLNLKFRSLMLTYLYIMVIQKTHTKHVKFKFICFLLQQLTNKRYHFDLDRRL